MLKGVGERFKKAAATARTGLAIANNKEGAGEQSASPQQQNAAAVIKLPIESAKKLRWFDNADLAELATRHAEERQDVLGENRALKQLLHTRSGLDEAAIDKLLPDKKAEAIRRSDDAVNRAMLIAARSEIERLRMEVQGSTSGGSGLQKQVDALEWTLGEKDEEIESLKDELADANRKLSAAQTEPSPKRPSGMVLGGASPGPSNEKDKEALRASKAEAARLRHDLAAARREAQKLREAAAAPTPPPPPPPAAAAAPANQEALAEVAALLREYAEVHSAASVASARVTEEESKLSKAEVATARAVAGVVEATRDEAASSARIRAMAQRTAATAPAAGPSSAEVSALTSERDRLSRELSKQASELTASKRDLGVARVSLDEAQARVESQNRAAKRMEASLKETQKRVSELEAELDGALAENASLLKEKGAAERELDAANSSLASARTELEHAESRRVEKLKEIRGGVGALEARAQAAEASLASERALMEEERQRVAKLERERDQLHRRITPLEQALESEKARAGEAQKSLEAMRTEKQRAAAELAAAKGELVAVTASADRLDGVSAALSAREAEVAELKRQLTTAESAMASARSDCEAMAEERLALQDALTASRAEYARSAREAANLQASAVEWENKREAREHWPESAKGLVARLEEQTAGLRGKVDGLEAAVLEAQEREERLSREAADAGTSVETLGERLRVAEKHWRGEFERKEAELASALEEARAMRARANELEATADASASARADALAEDLDAVRKELAARTDELERVRSRSKALLEEKEAELARAHSMPHLPSSAGDAPSTPSRPAEDGRDAADAAAAAAARLDAAEASPRTPAPPEGAGGDGSGLPASPAEQLSVELTAEKRRTNALLIALRDADRINELNESAKEVLKAELVEVRRSNTRDGVDLLYLKNVVVKGYETGETARLLDVLVTLLQFTPEEERRARKSSAARKAAPSSPFLAGLFG